MGKRNQRIINILNMISDGVLVFASYYIALFLRFVTFQGYVSIELWAKEYVYLVATFSVVLIGVYYACKMYGSYRFKEKSREIFAILRINGYAIVVLMGFFYLTRINDFSRGVLFLYWMVSSGTVILKRMVVRCILWNFRKLGYNQKHVIVIGSGQLAAQYLHDVQNNPQAATVVDGVVSQKKTELGQHLGTYEQLEEILEETSIDELIVGLEPEEIAWMPKIIACADKEGVRLSLIPIFNDYFPNRIAVHSVGKSRLIDMRATPLDSPFGAMAKRATDIVGALVLIVLTSPIMLITAIGVKLSSPGPILFCQDRIGLNKKPFKMLKFRSMRVNSTENTGWSKNVDPRKTRFGSFIRKCSIDELPQLFNVLKGDMSLVGPRPEVPHYVRQFKENVPLYLVRQQVRPGMTGWAQINGLRGDTSIEARVEYDIWYIQNWSYWLDIKILFKTAFGGWLNSEVINK